MKEYDVTLLDNLGIALKRGRVRKAKRMLTMLVSRCKSPVELFQRVRQIDYEMDKFVRWGFKREYFTRSDVKLYGERG